MGESSTVVEYRDILEDMDKKQLTNTEEKYYGTFLSKCEDDQITEHEPINNDDSLNKVHKKVTYDDFLEEIGEFGPWQQWLSVLFWVPAAVSGAIFMLGTFTMLEPSDYQCVPDTCTLSYLPPNTTHKCSYNTPVPPYNDTECPQLFSTSTVQCAPHNQFLYESFEMSSTCVTDWNLVCSSQWKVGFSSSMYMVGLMIGSFLVGNLSDQFGRKPTLLVMILVSTVSCLAGVFCPEYWSYTATRIVIGLGAQGLFIIGFSLSIEIVGAVESLPYLNWVTYKVLLANCIHIPFALGQAILTLLAYFFNDWRRLQLSMSVISALQLIAWFFTPESPRWLLAKNKIEEATRMIQEGARKNKKPVLTSWLLALDNYTADVDDPKQSSNPDDLGFKDLFHRPQVTQTLLLMFLWPITAIGYYGIALSMSAIGNNAFVSNALAALIELPAYPALVLMMDVWGRRPLFTLSLLFNALSCFGAAFTDLGVKTCFALLGKLFASSSFALVYIFTAELYPTQVRTTALGFCSVFARLGGILAPQLAILLPSLTFSELPLLIFGCTSLLGSVLAFQLPETVGHMLPENFIHVQKMSENQKPFWSFHKQSQKK